MNLFYNLNGVGDVAFLQVEPAEGEFDYTTHGDVVRITLDGKACLLYTSPSPRDGLLSRMPSSA